MSLANGHGEESQLPRFDAYLASRKALGSRLVFHRKTLSEREAYQGQLLKTATKPFCPRYARPLTRPGGRRPRPCRDGIVAIRIAMLAWRTRSRSAALEAGTCPHPHTR